MNKKTAAALLVAGALGLSACYRTVNTHGQVIYPSQLAQIQPGVTTAGEVLGLLGTPSTTGTLNPNRWYYMTDTQVTKPLNPNILENRRVIVLDIDPSTTVVTSVSALTEQDSVEIEADKATTKTYGQKMGIIDQVFSNVGLKP